MERGDWGVNGNGPTVGHPAGGGTRPRRAGCGAPGAAMEREHQNTEGAPADVGAPSDSTWRDRPASALSGRAP